MTLNRFLDVAYATLVEEYRRLGANLTEALERTREYAAGYSTPVTAGGKKEELPPPKAVEDHEAQNELALVQLEAMMAGVGGLGR